MIVLLVILLPLIIITLRVYLKSTPKHIDHRKRIIFNSIIFSLSIIVCLTVFLYSYLTTGQSVDRAWWPILAVLGSLFMFEIVLIAGGLFRNLIIFRNNRVE